MGYTHAEFDEYKSAEFIGASFQEVDYSGNTVQFTPEQTADFSLVYRNKNGFMGQAGVLYTDKMYWDSGNTKSSDGVTTVNAKLGYECESFDIYLYAANLFDKRYATVYEPVSDYTLVAPPRELGLKLVYRW